MLLLHSPAINLYRVSKPTTSPIVSKPSGPISIGKWLRRIQCTGRYFYYSLQLISEVLYGYSPSIHPSIKTYLPPFLWRQLSWASRLHYRW